MGKVAVVIKVFPEDMGAFESIKEAIKDGIKPDKIGEEELAFGAKAIKVTVVVEDEAGSGGVEEKIKEIKGVSEVQVESVGRL